MLPGSDSMGAPSSFTSRRPHASNLPQFELPPPQLPGFSKYQSYAAPQPGHNNISTSLTSVGNLLTPPSNSSVESPTSSTGITTASSASTQPGMQPYTPSGYSWSQSAPVASGYGYHTSMSPSAFAPSSKALFSPSINSLIKGNNSPSTNELPPPQYSHDMSSYQTSMSISAPSLPAMHHQHSVSSSITQPSPLSQQGPFTRPPPTPTYSYSSQPSSTTSQSYQYSAGPSPIQQSPVGAGPLSSMSPTTGQGSQIPSLQHHQSQPTYGQQRPFSYSLPGPVLSNINHPNNQLALVGGMPSGMVSGFNSGHAAQMQHMHGYGSNQPANDRPFRCDQCPQSFNRNHDLKRHKRIHLAVKPFPCGHCDKSFSRKDALKVCLHSF